jgi:GT2 family glycosyltransferase
VSATLPVTVVIPAWDRARELPAALASVARQSARPAEVVVVDDGSSDRTAEVAAAHGARVIRHDENRGVSAARNSGIEAAAHDWVAFLDSDDEWLPRHLERVWAQRHGYVLVAASGLWVRRPGRDHHLWGVPGRRPRVLDSPAPLVHDDIIPLSAVLARRDALLAAGGFDTRLTHAEDLDLWIRLLERGSAVVLPDVGVVYRLHAGQATTDVGAAAEGHRRAVLAYARRPWWPRHALARWETAAGWDELRRSSGGRARAAVAQSLLRRPQRLPLLVALFARRLRLRRWGARLDDRGRPVVALLPGAAGAPSGVEALLVDLRDLSAPLWLLSLVRRPPAAATSAGALQRLVLRLLRIPEAGTLVSDSGRPGAREPAPDRAGVAA